MSALLQSWLERASSGTDTDKYSYHWDCCLLFHVLWQNMRMISGCKLGTSGQRYQSAGEYLMETVKKAQPKTYKTFAELLEKESKKIESSTDQS